MMMGTLQQQRGFSTTTLILASIGCFVMATRELLQPAQRRRLMSLDPKTISYKTDSISTGSTMLRDSQGTPVDLGPVPVVHVSSEYHADGSKYPVQSSPQTRTETQSSLNEQNNQMAERVPMDEAKTSVANGNNLMSGTTAQQEKAMASGSRQQIFQSLGEDGGSSSKTKKGSSGLPMDLAISHGQKNKLEFIHVTKNGGSAIETAAAEQAAIMWGACHYRAIKYEKCESPDWEFPKTQRWDRMPAGLKYIGEPWHAPPHWQQPNRMEDTDTFLVVRNPYDRIVSEYYCSSFGYKGEDGDSVDVFNNWIEGNVTDVKYNLHGHMLPQHYYVYDEYGDKVVTHILRYENLSEEFDALMKEYGLPITLPQKSDSTSYHTYKLRGQEKNKLFTVHDISPANIQRINEVYARDFEYFRYNMRKVEGAR